MSIKYLPMIHYKILIHFTQFIVHNNNWRDRNNHILH